jgi:hypothetical protein
MSKAAGFSSLATVALDRIWRKGKRDLRGNPMAPETPYEQLRASFLGKPWLCV